METLIQPKILKGFRDFLPETEIQRSLLQEKLAEKFRFYGFVPIDTPVLEYSEILLRKSNGETEKQVFRFEDNGKRDVALRFDLTVPFARFVAEHKEEIYFPFKRYHIAKAWRGEKPQAGRYREFVQCDFDMVGSDSANADFEILSLIRDALHTIGVDKITIHLSHRGVFNAFLKRINAIDKSEDILRIVDKLAKIGKDEVLTQLIELLREETDNGIDAKDKAQKILVFISGSDSFSSTLNLMNELSQADEFEDASIAINRLKDLYEMMKAAGIEASYVLDPSITRGLDYYTGIVYETFLDDLPSIGSICSGGRYDNLAGLYMKDRVPGVGASIGLDRLLAGLEMMNKLETKKSFLDVEIFCLDLSLSVHYQAIAREMRDSGIAVEVFPDNKKINQQYLVAEKKGIKFGILIKPEDKEKKVLTLKNLQTRQAYTDLSVEQAVEIINKE